jgi:hypothetical protein
LLPYTAILLAASRTGSRAAAGSMHAAGMAVGLQHLVAPAHTNQRGTTGV